jgi:hypothetical protein
MVSHRKDNFLSRQNSAQDLCLPVTYRKTENCIINRECQAFLKRHQLDTFDSVFMFKGGETAKTLKERSVIRFEVEDIDATKAFYLKRHNLSFIGLKRLFFLFFPDKAVSEGIKEFKNICDFRKKKLATVVPVAAGEKFVNFFWVESFLLTEDFSPFISLEDFVKKQPEFFTSRNGKARKQNLLKAIAVFARRMHAQGLNHRDFNTTHILVRYNAAYHRPELAVFDLQRVDKARFFRFRWIIKSLARVNYSLPKHIFSNKDIIYLFKAYKGKEKIGFLDRCQWSWINRKTEKIRKHTGKIMKSAIK